MEEFILKYNEQLTNSDFYFALENKELVESALINLCEQMYFGSIHNETFTILSYATGNGFVEAFFAKWLLITGKCLYCNLVYSDQTYKDDDYRIYNVFSEIFNYMSHSSMYDMRIKKFNPNIKALYQDLIPNIFMSFNPQSYICRDGHGEHMKILYKFLMLIGVVLNNDKTTLNLNYLENINMIFLFFDSYVFNEYGVKDIRTLFDEESEYKTIIGEKFELYQDLDKTISKLNNLHYVTKIIPVDFQTFISNSSEYLNKYIKVQSI